MSSYILCKFWVFRREFLRNYRYVGLILLKVTEIVIPFQYWEILFSSGNDKPMYPGYQMFFLACDEEGRYVFGQRPKTPVGHFLRLDRNRKPRMKSHWQMMRQKTVNKDSLSHYFRTPIIHSVAPQILHVIALKCSWENVVLPGAFENNGLFKIWGQTECTMGDSKIVNEVKYSP